jgi:hypothetical protein
MPLCASRCHKRDSCNLLPKRILADKATLMSIGNIGGDKKLFIT